MSGGSGGPLGVNPTWLLCDLGATYLNLCASVASCLGVIAEPSLPGTVGRDQGIMQVTYLEQYGYAVATQYVLGGSYCVIIFITTIIKQNFLGLLPSIL